MRLEINEKKTKFFIVLQKLYNENECVKNWIYNFETVKDYTFGTVVTNKNDLFHLPTLMHNSFIH